MASVLVYDLTTPNLSNIVSILTLAWQKRRVIILNVNILLFFFGFKLVITTRNLYKTVPKF